MQLSCCYKEFFVRFVLFFKHDMVSSKHCHKNVVYTLKYD